MTRPLKTLERVLSKAGAGSRVDARGWIRAGRVKVNGQVVRDPDTWIDMQRDRVRLDGKPLQARDRVYLLLYKPTGYLTTYRDPKGRPTVYDLIADVGTFVSPVGRLDLDTSGLLLMTNDNQLAERVTNPESHVPKTYLAKASMRLTDEQLQRLRDGAEACTCEDRSDLDRHAADRQVAAADGSRSAAATVVRSAASSRPRSRALQRVRRSSATCRRRSPRRGRCISR